MAKTRDVGPEIRKLFDEGLSNSQIAKALDVSPATVSYHAKRAGFGKGPRATYDWDAVQAFLDEGHSLTEVRLKFGMSKAAIDDARKREAITYSFAETITADEYAATIDGRAQPYQRRKLKALLLKEGREYKCEICSISEWLGEPIALHLDHSNGDSRINRSHNLRFLCPNCHSQTETYGGRNIGCYAA